MPRSLRSSLSLALVLCAAAWGCGAEPRGEAARSAASAQRQEGPCRIVAPDAPAADAGLAACRRAGAQLARLLETAPPPGVVCLVDAGCGARPGEAWEAWLPPDSAPGEPRELGDGRRLSAHGYLTHEIAHRVATAMLYPALEPDTTGPPRYGSPLPDWVDEALALQVEPEPDRRERLELLFEDQTVYALPLRRFLYMAHPALAGVPAGAPLRRIFYGQSLAFASFVRERAGDAGFRQLVLALRDDDRQGRALTGVPGLPADGGELEQAWIAWLRSRQALYRTAPPQQSP